MKRQLLGVAAILLSISTYAQDNPLWMRYCAISPDGTTIAFTYKGDIYTVPSTGGRASQITTNPAHDTKPIWSPDGKKIAFASDRMGSMDIFEVNKEGGIPKRLTTHSGNETPVAYKDAGHILFLANIMPTVEDAQFPSGQFQQVYEVNTEGGRPALFSSMPMEDISINHTGNTLLYHDKKGYEDPWRKHHTSSITRDIWLCSLNGNRTFRKQTTFNGEDRTPVWASDDKSFYYLSEEKGSFNIFKRDIDGNTSKQITNHTKHPVRFLSAASNGTLCYGYDGEIYTVKEGAIPQKVQISIVTDKNDKDLIRQIKRSGATEISLSPDAKEIAFVLRGDVYVTSTEYSTTKQITNTPQQERDIHFSPDGRSIVYASERNGLWQIYQTSLAKKEEKQFAYATDIKEERLTNSDITSFQPQYSPDGKEVAFLENRTTIRVLNLKSKAVRTVMDGKYEYSYSDGDQWYQWSPDGRWILAKYFEHGGWQHNDIALVKADGSGEIHNLTNSGYSDQNPKWMMNGKAIIWSTDRQGMRSHGSWGAQYDIYALFLDPEAWDEFRMNKEELALHKEIKELQKRKEAEEKAKAEKKQEKKGDKADKAGKKGKKEEGDKKDEGEKEGKKAKAEENKLPELKIDFENLEDRMVRLTIHSSRLGDAVLTNDASKLYYLSAFEGGYDLWVRDFKNGSTRMLSKLNKGGGALVMSKDGRNLYLLSGGQISKVDMNSGQLKGMSYNAEFEWKKPEERAYLFDHVWQQVVDKFYDPTIHNIDWAFYKKEYARFLPYINNNYDFAEMLAELLGELNASHTGASYKGGGSSSQTAALGVFYDETFDGDGLKIKEILEKGPLDLTSGKIKPGMIIRKINNQEIKKGQDYFQILEDLSGKRVMLTIYDPSTKKEWEEYVKPTTYGNQNGLLYNRWVKQRQEMVEKLSNGKIGYVHVKSMDSPSFRKVYSEILGKYRNKEAIIVDTRYNGGGWLHEDLLHLLSGKKYAEFVPRGQFIGEDPFTQWNKPSAVLVSESNYSNAHGFPWAYKELGLGKVIGMPVPGTMTAVWWETLMDPSLVFGIPQVGMKDNQGRILENMQLEPDIKVTNDPASAMKGRDLQLEAAVESLMKEIK